MPTYVYETIPQAPGEAVEQFEVRQSISAPSLTVHPASGVPVRRVLSGGLATFTAGVGGSADLACGLPAASVPRGGCGSGCGCAH